MSDNLKLARSYCGITWPTRDHPASSMDAGSAFLRGKSAGAWLWLL